MGQEPKKGTLEMMAQTAEIQWPVLAADCLWAVRRERLQFGPCFLEAANCSAIFAALDSRLEGEILNFKPQ